jgi:NADPH:quinone reductase-like Zn-dependent oxidoreductase
MSTSSSTVIRDTMTSIVYDKEPGNVRRTTRPTPQLSSSSSSLRPPTNTNHVLVKVHAAGLNPVDAKDVMADKLPWAR